MFNDRAYGQSQAPSSKRMRHAGRSHPNRSFPRHASNDNAPYSDAHSIPSPCFPTNCRCAKTWKPSQTSDRRDSRHEAPDTRSDTTLHERNHRPTAPVPAATHRHATGGRRRQSGSRLQGKQVSRNTCEAPATPERTGLKYTDSSSLKAGIIDVQVTSAVAAPL